MYNLSNPVCFTFSVLTLCHLVYCILTFLCSGSHQSFVCLQLFQCHPIHPLLVAVLKIKICLSLFKILYVWSFVNENGVLVSKHSSPGQQDSSTNIVVPNRNHCSLGSSLSDSYFAHLATLAYEIEFLSETLCEPPLPVFLSHVLCSTPYCIFRHVFLFALLSGCHMCPYLFLFFLKKYLYCSLYLNSSPILTN